MPMPQRLDELTGAGPLDSPLPDPRDWAPTSDPWIQRLREDPLAASEGAEATIARYDETRDESLPRGEPRLEIVRERDAAVEALREATAALRRVR